MRQFVSLAASTLVCAVAFSSCFTITLPEPTFRPLREERFVRIDAARDRVEWIEIEHGLAPLTCNFGAHLAEVLARRRVFAPAGGLFSVDFDGADLHAMPIDVSDSAEHERRRIDALHVDDARLVLDERGGVALWRSGTLERASEWLCAPDFGSDDGGWALFESAAVNWIALPPFDIALSLGGWPEGDELFDPRSLELLAKARASGERFWSLRGNSLCLDAPLTAESASRFLSLLNYPASPDADDERFGQLLCELDTSDERLRARFAPQEGDWIRVAWTRWDALGETVLGKGAAHRLGFSVDSLEAYTQLRREHGLPELHAVAGEN